MKSIPRILKIDWIESLSISVLFNNGQSRIIDFRKVLKKISIEDNSPAAILFDPKEFAKVTLDNNTLSWSNVEQYISGKDKMEMKVPFEIGADVLLKYSHAEKFELMVKVGQLIREARLKSGLSQQELALMSGTSKRNISRIEGALEKNTLGRGYR